MLRTPEVLVFSSIQPIIFVLMFRFVFGGAITVPGESYVNFLMPGIFIQTVAFGSVTTAIGMATDLQGGVIDRFRSLPMARSARARGADDRRPRAQRVGRDPDGDGRHVVGFRVQTNPLAALAAAGIILLFAFALSWVFAFFGLVTANPEAAQAASFPFLAIFVFASSAFVPLDTMPGWLQAFAEHQPVTAAINAVRALVLGGPTASDVVHGARLVHRDHRRVRAARRPPLPPLGLTADRRRRDGRVGTPGRTSRRTDAPLRLPGLEPRWSSSTRCRVSRGRTRARVMTPTGLSPLGVVAHLASAEVGWFAETFAGEPVDPAWEDHGSFRLHADRLGRIGRRRVPGRVRAFPHDRGRGPSLDELSVVADEHWGNVSLRWIFVHMIEETARHAGHLDLMREQIDGRTGD